jgi:hypothetical protein
MVVNEKENITYLLIVVLGIVARSCTLTIRTDA